MLGELRRKKRILGIVSKGGSITSAFMLMNQCENPFIEHFDEVISICRRHDIVLSLGNTARSGCIHDRRDRMQLAEIRQNVELAHQAHSAGVQVIIEGAGGHIRSDRIAPLVKYYKKQSPYPALCCRPAAYRCRRWLRSYCRSCRGQYRKCRRSRLPVLYHPCRTSGATQPGCGKRGVNCIQDSGAHR